MIKISIYNFIKITDTSFILTNVSIQKGTLLGLKLSFLRKSSPKKFSFLIKKVFFLSKQFLFHVLLVPLYCPPTHPTRKIHIDIMITFVFLLKFIYVNSSNSIFSSKQIFFLLFFLSSIKIGNKVISFLARLNKKKWIFNFT